MEKLINRDPETKFQKMFPSLIPVRNLTQAEKINLEISNLNRLISVRSSELRKSFYVLPEDFRRSIISDISRMKKKVALLVSKLQYNIYFDE